MRPASLSRNLPLRFPQCFGQRRSAWQSAVRHPAKRSYSWHGDKIADTVENSTSDLHHAFVLDSSGLPRILFTEADPTQPGLRIARLLSDGTWSYSKPVDQGLGRPCGIVLDSDGYGRISYFVSGQLRYAAYYYSAQSLALLRCARQATKSALKRRRRFLPVISSGRFLIAAGRTL